MTAQSPIKNGKLVNNYPLIQLSSRLQLPFANLLLVSDRTDKKRSKKSESSKIITTAIHQLSVESGRVTVTDKSEDNLHLRKISKLRISVLNERKKKKIECFNSSFCSISDKNITKSKSNMLKKDFETAFKNMIAKKQISSKEKQLKASQELWTSLNLKKEDQLREFIMGEIGIKRNGDRIYQARNYSQKRLHTKTVNSFYQTNEGTSHSPFFSKFYLSGRKFHKDKVPVVKPAERGLPQQHLRNCFPVKNQADIMPWNHESRRYKTEVNDGKSGEITEWLKAAPH